MMTVWITGIPASGKSTLANLLRDALVDAGMPTLVLDGDEMRRGLCIDLGFSRSHRAENVRRIGEVALHVALNGIIAIVAAVSPYRDDRETVRTRHKVCEVPFIEVHLDVPVDVCMLRDPKGLYAKQMSGRMSGLTGLDAPYEPPLAPEFRFMQDTPAAAACVAIFQHVVQAACSDGIDGDRHVEHRPVRVLGRDRRCLHRKL
jgi:adenylyl-sulfate kinase